MLSFFGLCLILALGHILRMRFKLLQRLYLPSCVIGGLAGLVILQVFKASGRPLAPEWTAGWSGLPGLLINVVFACLFLGAEIPSIRTIWRQAGPQLAYGQVVAWGQYVAGIGLFICIVSPLFSGLGLPDMFGAIMPVGFEGGHGTAAGLKETFETLGWPAGSDYALSSATGGILTAIIFGMALVNWAARRGYTVRRRNTQDITEEEAAGVIPHGRRPAAGWQTVSPDAVETFSVQLVFVGAAVGLGFLMHKVMTLLAGFCASENLARMAASFPKFPLCMFGGLIVQFLERRYDKYRLLDAELMRRIQNTSLDFLVVAAIATIRVEMVAKGIIPLLIIIAGGIAWNVFCVVFLARRMLPDAWFERSIAEMGQSMGVTATGLLLLRVVDPDYKSPAASAFAYKQILHEPFMGGGIWTSMAIPLLFMYGPWPVFLISAGAVAAWLSAVFVFRLMPRPG